MGESVEIENRYSSQLIGFYHYQLDAKKRLAIPAKFRQHLSNHKELILAQGLEGCLTLYSSSSWLELNSKLETLSIKNKSNLRAIKRMMFASATSLQLDVEGRILIPQILLEYAQIKKDAVIMGLGNLIEIWAKQKWDGYQKKQKNAFTQNAAQLEI